MRGRKANRRTEEEFDQFVTSFTAALFQTGYLIVWDVSEAEDLVQECLWQIARRWPRVKDMDHPSAYAKQILVHLAFKGTKKRHRRHGELDRAQIPGLQQRDLAADLAFATVDDSNELCVALGALGRQQRAVLALRYFDDLPEADVAKVLGCSIGTVKSTSARALTRLRELLAEQSEQPTTTLLEVKEAEHG
jgi:RNA polymerase sigma-70 factor (sigma-E family)